MFSSFIIGILFSWISEGDHGEKKGLKHISVDSDFCADLKYDILLKSNWG